MIRLDLTFQHLLNTFSYRLHSIKGLVEGNKCVEPQKALDVGSIGILKHRWSTDEALESKWPGVKPVFWSSPLWMPFTSFYHVVITYLVNLGMVDQWVKTTPSCLSDVIWVASTFFSTKMPTRVEKIYVIDYVCTIYISIYRYIYIYIMCVYNIYIYTYMYTLCTV